MNPATVKGRLTRHAEGYGFVIPIDEPVGDIFIPPDKMGGAIHGDLVLVELSRERVPRHPASRSGQSRRLEGVVTRVVDRRERPVAGTLTRYRRKVFVRPVDDRFGTDIRLVDAPDNLADGLLVAVGLRFEPSRREQPWGELLEVLGSPDDPDIQYKIVCADLAIPMRFPAQVLDAANRLAISPDDLTRDRLDLRDRVLVTIDGETARDFDDAIGVEATADEGYRLGVHIADVSHYVEQDDLLDLEASRRGTSVYFPDRALPMLPERLSNHLCSLVPNQDRLAFSIFLDFDRDGEQTSFKPVLSVIRSRARLTYRQVHGLLTGKTPVSILAQEADREIAPMLERAMKLGDLLRRKRIGAGAIDLDLPEAEIVVDEKGEVRQIRRAARWESHRIIEEFMLAANRAVAHYLHENKVPAIYRIHEKPDRRRVDRFRETAAHFGYGLGRRGREYEPADFQVLLDRLAGRPEQRVLSYLLLRSLAQARYSALNRGHFALGFEFYTHFTSPIRRYPDLVVHRLLKLVLQGRQKTAPARHFYKRLEEIADRSSTSERAAGEAEQSIRRWMTARYMKDYLGEEFQGRITDVRANGIQVELEEHYVEGFLALETIIDDNYSYRPRPRTLVGVQRRRVFRLGDRLKVRLDRVDTRRGWVDFSLA